MLNNALGLIDTKLDGIEAIFVTHEHSDHVKGLEQIFRHTGIPVFATAGTIAALKASEKLPETAKLYDIFADKYVSASFKVSAFHTSHDAAESAGYVVEYCGRRFAVCTDTGVVTEEAEKALMGCEAVLLESNYDTDTLRKNPKYPLDVKKRILSDKGHLSNSACAEFAEKLVKSGTTRLILGHLSRENNTPNTAYSCTCDRLNKSGFRVERDFTLDVAPIQTEGQYIAL
jgi:phosphoribosyl 1,2-cyclic phosphodiesterase